MPRNYRAWLGKPLNWTEKWSMCKEAGIKFIHGVEIYLTESLDEKVRDNYHTILLAKNMDGVRELNSLVSLSSQQDHIYYVNRLTFDEFLGISDNIITTSACLASPLWKLSPEHPRYMELARKYTFLEIQPHIHPEQKEFNQRLLALSKEIGTPLIAGTDTHSSSKYKQECRAVLLDAKHKSYPDDDFDLSYKTYDELVEMFRLQNVIPETEYMEAIENTNRLDDMTEELELDTSIKYPVLYGSHEADEEVFDKRVWRMLQEKLDNGIIPAEQEEAFRDSITEEMRVFKKLNMQAFMLSMSELVCWCKEQGMAIGTARGSVGGSRVAYVTDIIDMNPEQWNTVFSRFCNEDREEIGDVDIDCIESDRPAIFQYIIDRFGEDKTARVAAFGTMQSKGVIDDVGRHLAQKFNREHPDQNYNPWCLQAIADIKKEFDEDEEETKKAYPELFYYYDGLVDTKISQSVHPAGMVISPITLADNYGVFSKDGMNCLVLDMDNIHNWTGLAKYDFLVLTTVQIIRDTCRYIGTPYPRTYEIDWNDQEVWHHMTSDSTGLFQFTSDFAFNCLRRFKPTSIFDMSLVTACIRPSGASYRDDLLIKLVHKNPSEIIDKLLEGNLGYLIYQEDTIKFLQQICGLSGSEADNVRRAIGRKQKDRLDAAMPAILDGYCEKSPKPREEAELEAKEFMQILEDSAQYMFNKSHSIAYCLLGYLCAYYRYYYPIEFITSFLNNASNDEDITNGTKYANKIGIKVIMPRWGFSKGNYSFDKETNTISKGIDSIRYMGSGIADTLYDLAHSQHFAYFMDVLLALQNTSLNSRQLDILIKIDFFVEFGNQRELLRINDFFTNMFKSGQAKQIAREKIEGTPLEEIVVKYSTETPKRYNIQDIHSILLETEDAVKAAGMEDLDEITKMQNFSEALGYPGYTSGRAEDRSKLYIMGVFPIVRKRTGKRYGYFLTTKSIGSGIESKFTVNNKIYNQCKVQKGDVIRCLDWERDGKYFRMMNYERIS